MTHPSIGLVVFDLGRVMIRLCGGWKNACEKANVPCRLNLDSPEDPARKELLRLIFLNETGRIDHDEWSRSTAAIMGIKPSQVTAISLAWLEGPYPGWHELLDRLQSARIQTACLSNTNSVHWKLMHDEGPNQLPLLRLDYRFASHLIQAHKPDPAIYHHVEQQTGINPEAMLFFDDVAENCQAARDRGWAAEVIEHPGNPVEQITRHLNAYGVL
ncbi:MAG: HAD-IA family hydrolase [Phycisphaeraceae bacterium]|nr:HAD-IA family hydrolase [Phycisphaeraceae bacterium]